MSSRIWRVISLLHRIESNFSSAVSDMLPSINFHLVAVSSADSSYFSVGRSQRGCENVSLTSDQLKESLRALLTHASRPVQDIGKQLDATNETIHDERLYVVQSTVPEQPKTLNDLLQEVAGLRSSDHQVVVFISSNSNWLNPQTLAQFQVSNATQHAHNLSLPVVNIFYEDANIAAVPASRHQLCRHVSPVDTDSASDIIIANSFLLHCLDEQYEAETTRAIIESLRQQNPNKFVCRDCDCVACGSQPGRYRCREILSAEVRISFLCGQDVEVTFLFVLHEGY